MRWRAVHKPSRGQNELFDRVRALADVLLAMGVKIEMKVGPRPRGREAVSYLQEIVSLDRSCCYSFLYTLLLRLFGNKSAVTAFFGTA